MRTSVKQALSILGWSLLAVSGLGAAADNTVPRQVVVIVWDGLRPDYVNEKETPALWKLASEGVVFRNHHSVYPSSTNVNGTAIVTGVYPGRSGVLANHVYRSDIDNRRPFDVENAEAMRKGDELSGGKYVGVPTLPEIVRGAGRQTVVATAKTVGLLQDRQIDPGQKDCAALFSGRMRSSETLASVTAALGAFPPARSFAQKDAWTTKALTDVFWKERVPAFSLLWLSEPDGTQHGTAPGSAAARAALKSSDDNLAKVLAALERKGVRGTTDIFVASDHGFSTIERSIDLRAILVAAGFDVVTEFRSEPKRGQIMLVGNGGTVLFYVVEHDPAVTQRLVEFLQQSDFAGVILARRGTEGTFKFAHVHMDNEHVPDVALSFRWNEKKNQFGIPGMIDADWNRKAGQGTHATLSQFDMHNTLIAAGPDFHRGQTSGGPSGNVDLAPTVLRILGITPPQPMDGRVLSEAMGSTDYDALRSLPVVRTTMETEKEFPSGTWRQLLRVSRVDSTEYVDEGNGRFIPRKP